jgi:hypothetical protein
MPVTPAIAGILIKHEDHGSGKPGQKPRPSLQNKQSRNPNNKTLN